MTSLWALKWILLQLCQVLCIVKCIDLLKTNKTQKNPKDIAPELNISYAGFKPRAWPSDLSLKIEASLKEVQMC